MRIFDVRLIRDPALPAGGVALPPSARLPALRRLRLGCTASATRVTVAGSAGELRLAPDVWQGLGIPYEGLRLLLRQTGPGEVELGPTFGALYTGRKGRLSAAELQRRMHAYFGHKKHVPGLFALGFDRSTD